MDSRCYDFILFQNTSNLRRPVTVQTKREYLLDYSGGFTVYNPLFLVVWAVSHINNERIETLAEEVHAGGPRNEIPPNPC